MLGLVPGICLINDSLNEIRLTIENKIDHSFCWTFGVEEKNGSIEVIYPMWGKGLKYT